MLTLTRKVDDRKPLGGGGSSPPHPRHAAIADARNAGAAAYAAAHNASITLTPRRNSGGSGSGGGGGGGEWESDWSDEVDRPTNPGNRAKELERKVAELEAVPYFAPVPCPAQLESFCPCSGPVLAPFPAQVEPFYPSNVMLRTVLSDPTGVDTATLTLNPMLSLSWKGDGWPDPV